MNKKRSKTREDSKIRSEKKMSIQIIKNYEYR